MRPSFARLLCQNIDWVYFGGNPVCNLILDLYIPADANLFLPKPTARLEKFLIWVDTLEERCYTCTVYLYLLNPVVDAIYFICPDDFGVSTTLLTARCYGFKELSLAFYLCSCFFALLARFNFT